MSGTELIPDLSVIVHGWNVKGGGRVGERNSWWLRRFKGVFRYWFGRLDLENRLFNFIPRGET